MLQDLDRYIRDEPDRAEKLVSTLSLYVSTLTYKLENPRYELNATLDAFRNQLKKLAVGFSALQTASFVVNLHQYGFFDHVPRAHLVMGGIRPYAPRQAQYDTWYEGIPRGK